MPRALARGVARVQVGKSVKQGLSLSRRAANKDFGLLAAATKNMNILQRIGLAMALGWAVIWKQADVVTQLGTACRSRGKS